LILAGIVPSSRIFIHALPCENNRVIRQESLIRKTVPNPGTVFLASASSTVAKAIGIVDILASKGEIGINLAELSVLIEMPKSSTHGTWQLLQELGFWPNDRIATAIAWAPS
jgi:hypothetical protein